MAQIGYLWLLVIGTTAIAKAADEFQDWHFFQWHAYKTTTFDASVYSEVRFRQDASELNLWLVGPK